jgi:amino acid adenylation domain-containing protein
LHENFAIRVREAPDRVAVTAPDGTATYRELHRRAEAVARALRASGVGPDVPVGLSAEPGVSLVAGMLGILAAGGAYVPLDPAYPAQRHRFLLQDAGVKLVVADSTGAETFRGCGVEVVDVAAPWAGDDAPVPAALVAPDNLAYVIHTSGSTGTPKGVAVEHRHVARLFTSTRDWFRFGPDDVWTLFHSPSFDFSVWEIWGALWHGGRLVVVPRSATRAPARLWELLRSEGVTVLNQTPSAFRQLVAADPGTGPGDLRVVVFGGERLDVSMLRPWVDRYGDERPRLVNMYGITETTVHVTYRRLRAGDLDGTGPSPIGVPIGDLRVSLRDAHGEPVPDGRPGELWVAGAGVARGYHGRPELTAERFVVTGGERWYRSGDRARRDPDGQLRYLGRIDDQIKVRGYRIEPGEVEACLAAHEGVAGAVVDARDFGGGDVRLVAHVQPGPGRDAAGLPEELRRWAGQRLPAHLCPSAYRVVAELPRTAQGKVDRAALPAGDGAAGDGADGADGAGADRAGADRASAAGGVAGGVSRAVAEVMRREVPVDADLFDLGATSLAFVRIVATVNERFGVALTGGELGDTASVTTLTGAINSALAGRPVGTTA